MKIGYLFENENGLPANASWYQGKFPFAALKNDNRRFLYNPKTNTIVIGKLDPLSGQGIDSSHEKEFKESGAPGSRHDYPLSGWIGIGGKYTNGVIHFAPPMITDGNEEVINAGKRIIDLFKESGATSSTVLRNFMKMGEQRLGIVSETFIQNQIKMVITESLLEPTPKTLKLFKKFLEKKWIERSKERGVKKPKDLQGACKFSSLFAQQLFGGELRGNWHHQFLVLPNGKVIDPVPVPEIEDPQYHDEEFWMNPDHKDSLASCVPRVKEWVKEFMTLTEAKGPKKGIDKGSQKREKIGFATDDPSKYVGKWEEYTEPQGINSPAGKKMTKTESINLDSSAGYRWESPHRATFKIGDYEYNAMVGFNFGFLATNGMPENPSVSFINTVFSTLINILLDYIKINKPDEIQFTGAGSRGKMYRRLVGLFKNKLLPRGYKIIDTSRYEDEDSFSIVREEYTESKGINSPAGKKMIRSESVNEEIINLYRGVNNSQEGNSYYTTDKDWARQFTQSGRDNEIKTVRYSTNRIFKGKELPKAYDLSDDDIRIMDSAWDAGYKAVWMDEGDNQPNSVYFMRSRPSELMEGNSMGPEFSRGGNNSSTGSGAVPVIVEPPELPRSLRGKKRYTGSKSPIAKVRSNVRKSIKNKVRKANSPVTEVFDDPSNQFPYEKTPEGNYEIHSGIENLEIIMGFESISSYAPGLPEGVNAGMVTMDESGMHLGIEPENVGMTRNETIKLFNSMMNIIRDYVKTEDPDRIYFVAVKPMEKIYQRLIRKFVDTNKWKVTIIKDVPIPMIGITLNAYMVEKKDLVTEMVRLPMNTSMNNDYEVKDGEDIVGKAKVTDGVIEVFAVNVSDEHPEDFRGHVMSSLIGTIVRDADGLNNNLSMQVEDPEDNEMKRFLERFGFRHVGQGVYRRTAGAATPPSVIY